uniref:Uncharacterized protein n=1 Tax=Romanomermis culicivorax TaxID=13658 RepID=A0A915III4_ROMCU
MFQHEALQGKAKNDLVMPRAIFSSYAWHPLLSVDVRDVRRQPPCGAHSFILVFSDGGTERIVSILKRSA